MFNPCGCGNALAGAEVYVHVVNSNKLVRAKKMDRAFASLVGDELLKGRPGDYLVEESGVRPRPIPGEIFEVSYRKLEPMNPTQ